jgi:hypothetical protein
VICRVVQPLAARTLTLAVLAIPLTLEAQVSAAKRSTWFATAAAEQGWDSNVSYASDSSARADFNQRITVSAQAAIVRARTTFGVSAGGAVIRYQTLKAFNANSYDINGTVARKLSANTSASAGAFFRNLLSSEVVNNSALTLLFNRASQKSVGGTVSASRRFSPFNTGTIDIGYTSVSFNLASLVPGSAFTGRTLFSHALRTRGLIGIAGDVTQGNAQGVRLGTQSLGAVIAPKLKKFRISIAAGVTRAVTDSQAAILPNANVSVGDSIGPGSYSLGYSRGASQAYGLGSLLVTDAVSASYDFQALRGNFVTLGGYLGRSKPSAGSSPIISLKSRSVFAGFRRVLKAGITVSGTGSYRQRQDIVQASGLSAQIGLGYSLRPR